MANAQSQNPAAADATAKQPSRAQQLYGDIAPKMAELTDNVLYGDIWERPGLSKRDRSLVTITALIALNRPDQLRSHINIGLQNGLTKDEIVETITLAERGVVSGDRQRGLSRQRREMNSYAAAILSFAVLASSASLGSNQMITVTHPDAQPSSFGSADNFTGSVRVDSRFQGSGEARISGATVTFEPGARTAWHTHPLGQTLIVTAGVGLVQEWGGPVQVMRPGDIVWIPPGVKHWHGASPTVGMSHIAFSEALDGKTVDWMEKVSDEQYTRH